jgi:hypothetical protein
MYSVKPSTCVRRWNDKVLKYRPHFQGQEQLVKDAISNPEAVYEGNTPEHKRFKGYTIPGQGFHFGGQINCGGRVVSSGK